MGAFIHAIGKRIGKLEVVEILPKYVYRCKCDCGNERLVTSSHFNAGGIKSCGCHKPQHGHIKGKKQSREYIAWSNMIARCHNPKNKRFADYGGRGIVVCDEWRGSFQAFIDAMGPCPDGFTIDRQDNTKGYHPGNCKWVSRKDNQRNRSNSMFWIVDGVKYATAGEAAQKHGVSNHTILAWCKGRMAEGRYYPPRPNCKAVPVYGEAG